MKTIVQIQYDKKRDRLTVGDIEIHCGQLADVLMPFADGSGVWEQFRVEGSDHWYLVGKPNISPARLWARY